MGRIAARRPPLYYSLWLRDMLRLVANFYDDLLIFDINETWLSCLFVLNFTVSLLI